MFVAGFEYVLANDTAELRPFGVHWGVQGGSTEAVVSQATQIIGADGAPTDKNQGRMRLKLICRKCRRPEVTVRLETLAPLLDRMRACGVSEFRLFDLAAML
ncbi:hypothetical protein [Nocardioides sp. AN3]